MFAARVREGDSSQIVSATFSPRINEEGQATLKLTRIRGGELPLPVDRLRAKLAEQLEASGHGERAADAMAMLAGEPFEPVIPLDRDRQVRVVAMELTDDDIVLTVHREPATAAAR